MIEEIENEANEMSRRDWGAIYGYFSAFSETGSVCPRGRLDPRYPAVDKTSKLKPILGAIMNAPYGAYNISVSPEFGGRSPPNYINESTIAGR